MPRYRVQLKQGSKTLVERVEASSVSSVQAFYSSFCTMKVTEILKIEYEVSSDATIPIDDFNYISLYKAMIKDTATNKSKQVVFHHLKNSINENDMAALIQSNLKIDGSSVDSVYCSLLKFK